MSFVLLLYLLLTIEHVRIEFPSKVSVFLHAQCECDDDMHETPV